MSSTHSPTTSVCAVIVAYFPDVGHLQELLSSLTGQVDGTVVVDNTPVADGSSLEKLVHASNLPNIHTIRFQENRGVAAAQNAGISWAMKRSFGFVLLLDQDSTLETGMVDMLCQAVKRLLTAGVALAAVGPRYTNPPSGRSARIQRIGALRVRKLTCPESANDFLIQCDVLISSGTLIPTAAIGAIGMLDESLFIDGVDHEWCLRARHRGFSVYTVCHAHMRHRLGSGATRYWLGRWRHAPMHSPNRYYYMMRNALLLGRRRYVPLAWTVNQIINVLALLSIALCSQPERLHRLSMLLRGTWHGIWGRTGPL